MKIGSIKENLKVEQRIAVTPEIIKKYKSLELKIILPKGYGEHLGISDQEFIKEGAEILDDDSHKKTWENFTKFVLWGTISVIAILVILAILLL